MDDSLTQRTLGWEPEETTYRIDDDDGKDIDVKDSVEDDEGKDRSMTTSKIEDGKARAMPMVFAFIWGLKRVRSEGVSPLKTPQNLTMTNSDPGRCPGS